MNYLVNGERAHTHQCENSPSHVAPLCREAEKHEPNRHLHQGGPPKGQYLGEKIELESPAYVFRFQILNVSASAVVYFGNNEPFFNERLTTELARKRQCLFTLTTVTAKNIT